MDLWEIKDFLDIRVPTDTVKRALADDPADRKRLSVEIRNRWDITTRDLLESQVSNEAIGLIFKQFVKEFAHRLADLCDDEDEE
ncbi:hypothetical protein [Varibaculum cambriense]|uniref:hypothetical protein n=1 Tax=Varibaculum cambriense TaxID=184870 RepID=UPI0003B44BC3|nr:hypothetical protein [Varibaculum cambriense]MDU5316318.1 hypothetical protein [Varibaculum cambriense]